MFFANNNNQSNGRGRQPDETKQVTDSLVASIWTANGESGTRFHWDLARAGQNGQTFKTKRPEDLLEVPSFVARLSETFANSSALDEGLRKRLAGLSVSLYGLIEELGSANGKNGDANKETGASSLFSA